MSFCELADLRCPQTERIQSSRSIFPDSIVVRDCNMPGPVYGGPKLWMTLTHARKFLYKAAHLHKHSLFASPKLLLGWTALLARRTRKST